jgi:NAD(P)-dependent dehydrogenase (short-subunit alcohol dehydrogenase family)
VSAEPRVCLLLGAGGQLGNAFCRYLSSRYMIAAVHRSRLPLFERQDEQVVDPLNPVLPVQERRTTFYPVAADIAESCSAVRIAELTLAVFGRVDLVVNAMVCYDWGPAISPDFLGRMPQQFLINVVRPLEVVAALYQRAWQASSEDNRRHNRNVINVSSVSAFNVYSGRGQIGYSASKAALNIASLHLASELAPVGVRVNVLAPNAFPRIVSTERVLAALCELDAGSDTGEIRVVDHDPLSAEP